MAKLYAEITSDKGGRVVSKGGVEYIRIVFQKQNKQTHSIIYRANGTVEVLNYDDIPF